MNAKEEIIKELGNHKEGLIGILEKEIKLHKFQAHRYSSEDSYNKIQETKTTLYLIKELFDSE